jgi:hypothetical protein
MAKKKRSVVRTKSPVGDGKSKTVTRRSGATKTTVKSTYLGTKTKKTYSTTNKPGKYKSKTKNVQKTRLDKTDSNKKTKQTIKSKTVSDGKGSGVYSQINKSKSGNQKRTKNRVKEMSGSKSKGTTTYVTQKIKGKPRTSKYVGRGTGRRK